MAETAQKSQWQIWLDEAKEVVTAGVGVVKGVADAKLTEAQAKALNKQKAAPNWTMIAVVSGIVVIVVAGVIWLLSRGKKKS